MHPPFAIDGACLVDDRGLILARGLDAAAFLHGQLTNDVLGLPAEQARLAGFCSAKGRLQASFLVWRGGAEEFLLMCPLGVLAPTLKRLSMFVLRAKCRLSDASGEHALHGLAGPTAEAMVGDMTVWARRDVAGGTVIRLPDAAGVRRALHVAPAGTAVGLEAPALALDTWRWLEVQSGIVAIEAAIVDRFVPQMVNYEVVGGVDFQKGCYPGQEVVARSQYRGTTKRRTFLFDCDELPQPGADVFVAGMGAGAAGATEPEAAGTVANAAPHPGGGASALVEMRLGALDSGTVHLGSASGPVLRRVALPYAVATQAETAA